MASDILRALLTVALDYRPALFQGFGEQEFGHRDQVALIFGRLAHRLNSSLVNAGSARCLDPSKSLGHSSTILGARCGRAQGFSCAGLAGSVSLSLDVVLDFEGEVRIVRLIVTTAADLKNDARITFIAQA